MLVVAAQGLRSDAIDHGIDAQKRRKFCDVSTGTNRKARCQREDHIRLARRSVNLELAATLAAPTFSRVAHAAGSDTVRVGTALPVSGTTAILADSR